MAVGGDQSAHLLWRLRNGEAPQVHKVGGVVVVCVCVVYGWVGGWVGRGEGGVLALSHIHINEPTTQP